MLVIATSLSCGGFSDLLLCCFDLCCCIGCFIIALFVCLLGFTDWFCVGGFYAGLVIFVGLWLVDVWVLGDCCFVVCYLLDASLF